MDHPIARVDSSNRCPIGQGFEELIVKQREPACAAIANGLSVPRSRDAIRPFGGAQGTARVSDKVRDKGCGELGGCAILYEARESVHFCASYRGNPDRRDGVFPDGEKGLDERSCASDSGV